MFNQGLHRKKIILQAPDGVQFKYKIVVARIQISLLDIL